MTRGVRTRECDAIGELIAWYVNGTLDAADCARVEAHTSACERCRITLAMETRVAEAIRAPVDNVEHSPHAGWQKMLARLDAEEEAAVPRPVRRAAARRKFNWPVAMGIAVAVQAAAIVVLAIALVQGRQQAEAPRYRTLSNVDATLAARGSLVRIAFDATVDESTARALAQRVEGRVLAGPSPENVYTFVFDDADSASQIEDRVRALRREPHVLLVEPVVLGPADPSG